MQSHRKAATPKKELHPWGTIPVRYHTVPYTPYGRCVSERLSAGRGKALRAFPAVTIRPGGAWLKSRGQNPALEGV